MDSSHERARKLINDLVQRTNSYIQSHLAHQLSSPRKGDSSSHSSNTKKKPASSKRLTEREEDEILLETANDEADEEVVTRLTQQPSIIVNCTMRDYQLEGLNWMIRLYQNGVSGILADEMGLGKTLQTISMMAYLKEFRDISGPHIVLVPLSTLGNWCREIARFCPSMRVCRFHGDAEARAKLLAEQVVPREFDILVTTFEMASKEKAALKRVEWEFFIVDEAHRLKNENSLLARHAREFRSKNRLLVTGTPLQNNLHELWALLNFLLPTIFSSSEEFDAMFSNVETGVPMVGTADPSSRSNLGKGSSQKADESSSSSSASSSSSSSNDDMGDEEDETKASSGTTEEVVDAELAASMSQAASSLEEQDEGYVAAALVAKKASSGESVSEEDQKESFKADILMKLHAILRPFMLRRLKSDVASTLPPKKETLVYVGMPPLQRKVYKDILLGNIDTVNGSCKQKTKLMNVVMQLRKAANHPYLFDNVEDLSLDPGGEHVITNCGKMNVLDKLLKKLKAADSRVLIFSQMTRTLDILEDYCWIRGFKYCRIDGSTSPEDREEGMHEFNKPGSEKFIFLLSTRAGGLGINLATADVVVLYDSDWNPQVDLQAQDRAHRIGQKKPVSVYRFVTEDTIEERIVNRAETKLRLDAMVIQQGRLAQGQKKMTTDDMMSMIRCGAERIFKATDNDTLDEDIDLILQKGEAKTQELNSKLQRFTGFNISLGAQDSVDNLYAMADQLTGEGELDPETKKILDYELAQELANQLSASVGKRRKGDVNYFQDNFFANAASIPTIMKPKRIPHMYDFQLYNVERITEISDKEMRFFLKYQNSLNPPKSSGITQEEFDEREKLLEEGFPDWRVSEYRAYVRGCEKYGRKNVERIAADIPGKSVKEVQAYGDAFWSRPERIKDFARISKLVEAGEVRVEQNRSLSEYAAHAMSAYNCKQAALEGYQHRVRPAPKGRGFDPIEDTALMWYANKGAWGDWAALHDAVQEDPSFGFNYFIRSRTAGELGRRIDQVVKGTIRTIADDKKKKEAGAEGGADGEGGKKRGGKGGAKGAGVVRKEAEPSLTTTASASSSAESSSASTSTATSSSSSPSPSPSPSPIPTSASTTTSSTTKTASTAEATPKETPIAQAPKRRR